MPDPTPAPPPKPPAPPAVAVGPTINIGEEYGTAKKNLPPAKIVLIAIGAVLIVVLIASFVKRAKPQAAGSLDNVAAVEIPDQNSTMVALTFTLRNSSDKILYVHTVESTLKAPGGDYGCAFDNSKAKKLTGWEPKILVRDRIPVIAENIRKDMALA